jgi:hypothetical protein
MNHRDTEAQRKNKRKNNLNEERTGESFIFKRFSLRLCVSVVRICF